jgi:HemY protein
MRKLLLWAVLALCVGALLFQFITNNSSYLLIVIGNTSIEMNFWLAIGLLLLTALIIYFVITLVRKSTSVTWRQLKRALVGSSRRARRQTAHGLVDFIEGNWRSSLRLLTRSAKKADAPLVNYLAAARSAYELGDEKQALELLNKAQDSTENSELAVALTQARMQLVGKKYEQCAATLQRAKKLAPNHRVVLDLLWQVYVALQDWAELERLLPTLVRYKIVGGDELQDLKLLLYRYKLESAALPVPGATSTAEERLVAAWKSLPKEPKRDAEILLLYVDLLIATGNTKDAEPLVRKALKKHWDSRLITRYGTLKFEDPQRQLLEAEGWLQERPNNTDLLLALGRLSLRNRLWGKAKDYFHSSLAMQGTPEAYAELARLSAHMGDLKQSADYSQKGLMLAAEGLPDLPMPSEKPYQITE